MGRKHPSLAVSSAVSLIVVLSLFMGLEGRAAVARVTDALVINEIDLDSYFLDLGGQRAFLPLVVRDYTPPTPPESWTGEVTKQFRNCGLTRLFGYTLDRSGGLYGGVWVHYWADGWQGAWAESLWYDFGAGTPWTGDDGNWDGVLDNRPRDGTWHVCVVPAEGSWDCISNRVDVTTSSDCENGYQVYHITFRLD